MTTAQERRLSRRFPLERRVQYRVRGERPALAGEGRTLNISSKGVLFTIDQTLAKGCAVQVEISWPVLLEDARPIKLVARGPIVWCDGDRAAMKIEGWEFHTLTPVFLEGGSVVE
jgi:PilZ domain